MKNAPFDTTLLDFLPKSRTNQTTSDCIGHESLFFYRSGGRHEEVANERAGY